MFDLGWTELLVIGIVALIVIGPKDLPGMFRTLGRFTAKMRNMARDFQNAMEDAADQAGVKDMADGLKDVANPKKMGLDALNDAADKFEKWDPAKETGDTSTAGEKSETARLSEERAAQADAIRQKAAEKATARKAAEAAAASAEAEAPEAAPAETTGKSDV